MSVDRTTVRWNGWGWTAATDPLAGREELWTWLAERLGVPALPTTPARPLDEITLAPPRLTTALRNRFIDIVGADGLRDDKFERAFHARGRSYHDLLRLRAGDLAVAADAVLYPRGSDAVLAVLALASDYRIAVVPYGGGTSVVGGVSATGAGYDAVITLDLSAMERVIDIDLVSGTATAEAGIYGPALEKALQAKAVTLGHYPQSFEFSTLGGWIAHRGAGQNSARYGKAEDWLVSSKVATPRGMLTTESFPASAAGPRLTDLIVGSEGAFGVVTEATFSVQPVPEASEYGGYLFRDFASGMTAVRRAMQDGLPLAMLRLSDVEETRFYRTYSALGKPRGIGTALADRYLQARGIADGACALIFGIEGAPDTVAQARKRLAAIVKTLDGVSVGRGPGERWRKGRFQAPYARDPMMDRGVGLDTVETAASWKVLEPLYAAVTSALEQAIRDTAARPGARGVVMAHISHAYRDGASLYFTFLFPRALGNEIAQWQTIKKAASDAIRSHGGTISHHHGVGEDHLPWIAQEKGALGIEIYRAIKRTLDPSGILNPGKLVPP
jgi:alkyldihydroxyacetonephosphate synthase